jgi:multidrug efflux pump subunit AcrA (membrane-fusion protein)
MIAKGKHIARLLCALTLCATLFSCGGEVLKDGAGRKGSGKSIVETGELAAVNSRAFVMARYGRQWYEMRIVGMLEHGAIVAPGDSVIQLDDAEIKRYIIENEALLETEEASLEKLMINQQNARNDAASRVRGEEAAFQLKTLAYESSRFESERNRQIAELEYRQAQITLEKEQQRRQTQALMDSLDRKVQLVRIQRIRNDIENAYAILPQLTLRTPIGGVFQIFRNWNGTFVQIGDVKYPGNRLANVPDLSRMKVETFIGETDFLKIYEGQSVIVRLDAMPDIPFEGTITYIGKLCQPREYGSRQKGFEVTVELTKQDERLKPGMTVSCEFLDIRE